MTTTDPKVFDAAGRDCRRFIWSGGDLYDVFPDIVCERKGERAQVTGVKRRWIYHSPDGFEWGYGGSGPADLALNILGAYVEAPEAWRLHQRFKFDVIAKLPREGGVIRPRDVYDWILNTWAQEQREARQAASS